MDVAAYLEEARRALRGHKRLADAAIAQLRDQELFIQLDSHGNSVAILMQHVGGNLRSRFTDFLLTDGEKPDRNRDREFELAPGVSREQVAEAWENGWRVALDTLASLQADDLARTVTIRDEPLTALQAVHRVVAHAIYHVGQIIFLAKHLRGEAWQTLSIPPGKSEEFNAEKRAQFAEKLDKLNRTKFP